MGVKACQGEDLSRLIQIYEANCFLTLADLLFEYRVARNLCGF